MILRSNLTSGSHADIAKAVAYGKRVKFYPLAHAGHPPETTFVDAIDVLFDSTILYDLRKPDSYPVEGRGVAYAMAYFSAKHLGTGQTYLMTIVDKVGQPLDGGSVYRLRVPANVPVKLYWSATLYDRATHALIRDQQRGSRSSLSPDLQQNTDGSVDIYFRPQAPVGMESNWTPTSASGTFEVLFRLYGPKKPFFDRIWVLPDIEKIAAQ